MDKIKSLSYHRLHLNDNLQGDIIQGGLYYSDDEEVVIKTYDLNMIMIPFMI